MPLGKELKNIIALILMPAAKKEKTSGERLITVNEIKMKCIEHDLTNDTATKVLFIMLNNYHRDGTTYINKELKLSGRYDIPRKYVINLWNDQTKTDTVLIRALDDEEVTKQSLVQRTR
jgi:hypothetical protein